MYTQFKEYTDTKQRLTYVTKNVADVLTKIHALVYFLLPDYGHV
jgi:hypothetical protein